MWQCQNALRFNSLAAQTPFPPIVGAVRIFHFYYYFFYYFSFFKTEKKKIFFFCLFFCTKNTSTKTRRCWVHSAEKGMGFPLGDGRGGELKIGKKIKGKSQMEAVGGWVGRRQRDGQTDIEGGTTHSGRVLFGAPVPGGTRGDCPCGGTRVPPPPYPGVGVNFPKMVVFQPNLRQEALMRGVAPPSALRGVGVSWIWGAESS